jgi:hypothetical protein
MMKLNYLVLAAAVMLCAGCAGESESVMKVSLGFWQATLNGGMLAEDSDNTSDSTNIKFDKDDYVDFDRRKAAMRAEVQLGTTARTRLAIWQLKFPGAQDIHNSFSFGSVDFGENEFVHGDITFLGIDAAEEFVIVPLEISEDTVFRGFVGVGLKYFSMSVSMHGENESVDETLPLFGPFLTIGAECDFLKYFSGGIRMDLLKLKMNLVKDVDLTQTDLKVYVGAYFALGATEADKEVAGSKLGGEIGYLNQRMNLVVSDVEAGSNPDDISEFDANIGFGGAFMQVVFIF